MAVGVTVEQAEKLDCLERFLEQWTRHMAQLLKRIGVPSLGPVRIRNLLHAASEQRRKVLLYHTRQLGRLAKLHQQLLGEYRAIEEQINKVRELEI